MVERRLSVDFMVDSVRLIEGKVFTLSLILIPRGFVSDTPLAVEWKLNTS